MRFLPLAAALLGAACTRGDPDLVVRPQAPGPAPAARAAVARVVHLADFGDDTRAQARVADAMEAFSRATPVDLVLHPGDNVYECGPDPSLPGADACAFAADDNAVAPGFVPPADPSFEKMLERALSRVRRDGKPVPVLLTLGNHDVAAWGECASAGEAQVVARRKACLSVARRSPSWSMPGRHWVKDLGPARFIGVDSNLIKRDYGNFRFDDEVAFVAAASAPCRAGEKTCFVVGHHPSFSAGEHRPDATPEYLARVKRIEDAAGPVAAWLSGHEHQLEHLRAPSGYDVLVSGSGSRPRPREKFDGVSAPGARLLFASTRTGFAVLDLHADGGWSYRFVDSSGKTIHCCTALARGHCEPVTCPP